VQVRPAPAAPGTGVGLQVRVLLEPEDPPITACDPKVHEAKWATQLPLLRLTTSPQAQVHPYSLLAGIELEQVELSVDVQGVQDLVLANQLGPLDPNKPFAPFGPVPTTSSFLLLGAAELAAKPLDALRVRLRWGGLPQAPGGFAALYDTYGREQAEGPFTAAVSVLRDGQWVGCSGASAAQPLFAPSEGNEPVPQDQVFDVDAPSLQQHMRPGGDLSQGAALARNGVLRLVLNQPSGAFGHAAYPGLLAAALQSRARRFGHLPMPQAPYTPQLERITLAYRSHTVLKPSAQLSDLQADPPRLLHEHPFGVTEVRAAEPGGIVGVLPDLGPNGNLCIGLEGAAEGGLVTLLFQLDEAGAADWIGPGPRPPLRWSLLRNERWEALPASRVLVDGTQGLLSSGIVRLDLEPMPDLASRVFGRGLLWLRLTMDEGLETCARLVTVHAQALELRRESAAAVAGLGLVGQALAPGAIAGPQNTVPGLTGVLQPEASVGLRAAEGPREMRTRAGERLRHKNRASLAWDVERLVLQAFPEVFKVKCFTPPQAGCKPGEPLVVVVPHVRRNDPDVVSVAAKLDAVDLQRIRDFLGQQMSPFVRPLVRNASYERVQLRCRVQLLPRVHTGAVLREIERRIAAWLSPWHDAGPGAQFEWQLSADDLQGIVRLVPGVAVVGPVSLLRIARDDDGAYSLADTARRPDGVVSQLQHRHAWSLMLPMETHLIDTGPVPDKDEPLTVVSRMRIGSTFVITQGAAP
jgi:hypothetical protein